MKCTCSKLSSIIVALLFASVGISHGQVNFRLNLNGRSLTSNNVPLKTPDWAKSGKTKFQEALFRSDVKTAEKYVQPGFIDDPIKGYPPVFHAALHGDTDMVLMLARHGASMQFRVRGHSMAFFSAKHPDTAAAVVRCGGGTRKDVADGRAAYAHSAEQERIAARESMRFVEGMARVVAAMEPTSRTPTEDETRRQMLLIDRENKQQENREASSRGEQVPHPGYGGY